MRLSYTAMALWDKGEKLDAIAMLMGQSPETTEYMVRGKEFHTDAAREFLITGRFIGLENNPLPEGSIVDHKLSSQTASRYLGTMQMPFYGWLASMARVKGIVIPPLATEYKLAVTLDGITFVGRLDALIARAPFITKGFYLVYDPHTRELREIGMHHITGSSNIEAAGWAIRIAHEIEAYFEFHKLVQPDFADNFDELLYDME